MPLRFLAPLAAWLALVVSLVVALQDARALWAAAVFAMLGALGLWDLIQVKHSIRRNYPILAHMRFIFEKVRPEIRQYFFEDDTDERPFSRNQRSIVYQRAKQQLDKRPFGTQLDVHEVGHEWIAHSIAPVQVSDSNFRVLVGEGRAQPYSISVFNISAMSFGALSANAIQALNRGAAMGGFAHDTGEGSISRHHRPKSPGEAGGDIIWEIASGYFGCRTPDGAFDPQRFAEQARLPQVKMIEVKLSQGAKPGHGGVLPAAKVTREIAEARGVPEGVDCVSPAGHPAFSTPMGLLEFIERLRELSGGKPVGFKFCVGHPWEWFAVVKAMLKSGITPDFIVVDGAEGGTGAAPLEFADHVGAPLQEGLLLVHNTLVGAGLRSKVKLGASGKIITAFDVARTLALGADWCNSARGFMFALGCLQAQTCHTGRCPTGVATQDALRQRALFVPDKAERVANFHRNTLKALAELIGAAGLAHPAQLRPWHIVKRTSETEVRLMSNLITVLGDGDLLTADSASGRAQHAVFKLYWPLADPESFQPTMQMR
jgi:glutamate synthase domain-containing protein 2